MTEKQTRAENKQLRSQLQNTMSDFMQLTQQSQQQQARIDALEEQLQRQRRMFDKLSLEHSNMLAEAKLSKPAEGSVDAQPGPSDSAPSEKGSSPPLAVQRPSYSQNPLSLYTVAKYTTDSPMGFAKAVRLQSRMDQMELYIKDVIAVSRFIHVSDGLKLWQKVEAYCEKGQAFNECGEQLAHALNSVESMDWCADHDGLRSTLQRFSRTLRDIQAYRGVLLLSLESTFIDPLSKFLETAVHPTRFLARAVQQGREACAAAEAKILSCKPGTAQHIIDQRTADAVRARQKLELQRYQLVRSYDSVEIQVQCSLVERVCSALYAFAAFFHHCHDQVAELSPAMQTLQVAVEQGRQWRTGLMASLQPTQDKLETHLAEAVAAAVSTAQRSTAAAQAMANSGGGSGMGRKRLGSSAGETDAMDATMGGGDSSGNVGSGGGGQGTGGAIGVTRQGSTGAGGGASGALHSETALDHVLRATRAAAAENAEAVQDYLAMTTLHTPKASEGQRARAETGTGGEGGGVGEGDKPASTTEAGEEGKGGMVEVDVQARRGGLGDTRRTSDGGLVFEAEAAPDMQGYLLKQSSGVMKDWKRRFFFIQAGVLWYVRSDTNTVPEKVEELVLCNVRESSEVRYAFELRSPGSRVYLLQAPTATELHDWVAVIRRVAESAIYSPGHRSGGSGSAADHAAEKATKSNSPELKARLAAVQAANPTCADCTATNPDWASINLGAVICIACSGIHRAMGTHITKVRSLVLDAWDPVHVDIMERLGNEKVNAIFEGSMDQAQGWTRPAPGTALEDVERYIRAKYQWRGFVKAATISPEEMSQQLYQAASAGDLSSMLAAIAGGADVAAKVFLTAHTDPAAELGSAATGWETPLHAAARTGQLEAVEMLIQNGAGLRMETEGGLTASMVAELAKQTRVAEYLRAKEERESSRPWTPAPNTAMGAGAVPHPSE